MADAFNLLRSDHQMVLGLLNAFESGEQDPAGLADRLVREESAHEAAEEMYFWPLVRDQLPDGDTLAAQALAQESEGKQLLDRIQRTDPAGADFAHLIDSFAVAAKDHIAFEEKRVWDALKPALTPPDVEALGTNLEVAKRTGPTRPHPARPRPTRRP